MKGLLASIVLLLSFACATHGRPVDPAAVSQLQPGVSTVEDAIRMLGKPTGTSTGVNGVTVLVWMYSRANALTGNTEASSLSLVFKDGKLARKSVSEIDRR